MTKKIALGIIAVLIVSVSVGYAYGARNASTTPSMSKSENRRKELALHKNSQKELAFHKAMRNLWGDHMQWTYATVDAFYHNQAALQPTLDRLLQNQKDIGAAIVPFYGQAAGDKLTALLTTHIQQAVPVLTAAKVGDKKALDKALSDWYANAKEIADFLSAANPKNWPKSATEPMMKEHIDTTTTYAVDLLKGDYAKAIKDYDDAYHHMMMLSDTLSTGIIKQFPEKFK